MARMEIHESFDYKQQNIVIKDWLWRYRRAKLEVRRLEGEYQELVSVQESAGAVSYDGMPGGGKISDMSDLIIVRDRILTKLVNAKARMAAAYVEISNAIAELDNVEQQILSLRYIQLKEDYKVRDMDEIGTLIVYSPSFVKKKHGEALQKLVPIIARQQKSVYENVPKCP